MTAAKPTDDSLDAITDALLVVSRVLVAVSARSIGDVDDTLTIPQFRSLVLLSNVGPVNVRTLALLLRLHPSSTRRILESLVTAGLAVRHTDSEPHRHEVVDVSARGWRVVNAVTTRRREAIAEIVSTMPPQHLRHLVRALTAFADASEQRAFDIDDML